MNHESEGGMVRRVAGAVSSITERTKESDQEVRTMHHSTSRPGCCPTSEHALSRRMFLQGMVAGGVAFGGFAHLFSAAHAQEAARRQKHVLLVYMSGGPSQFETWDPKPGQRTAGAHMTIPTALPGVRFDEFMPNLARLANRMAVIRSMTSPSNDHVVAGLHTQSGYLPSPAIAAPPHWLSVCARLLPRDQDNGLPAYVMLGQDQGAFPTPGPGYLGAEFQALMCPGNGQGPADLPRTGASEIQAQERREGLRSRLAQGFAQGRPGELVDTHNVSFSRMSELMRRHTAFDITQEPPRYHERYGPSGLGRNLLLARRLIEQGVSFVRVQHQGGGAWDKHRNAFRSQRYITSEFDHAVGALVEDLVERGLWEHTLLVCMGEFGRTPMINGQGGGGRDHWSRSWSMSLGGCGIKGGVVVGSTNQDGTEVRDRPVTVPDLFCTFYRALGINHRRQLYFRDRPIPLVENQQGQPIAELL